MAKKDNTGIKSILSIHTPAPVVRVAKKPRPTVQEMLDFEDLLNIYDPNWHIPDPLEIPKTKPTDESSLQQDKIKKNVSKKVPWKYTSWSGDNKPQKSKSTPMPLLTYLDKMNVAYSGQVKRKYDDKGNPIQKTNVSKKVPWKYTSWADSKSAATAEPIKNKSGHTKAQKDKMIMDWLTRPPVTDAEKAASALWKAKNQK